MPPAYFRQVSESSQERHLRAITALSSENIAAPEVRLIHTDANKTDITYLSSGGDAEAALSRASRQLYQDAETATELRSVRLFNSRDNRVSINMFQVSSAEEPRFGGGLVDDAAKLSAEEAESLAALQEYLHKLKAGDFVHDALHAPPLGRILSESSLRDFLAKCTSRYVTTQLPRLLFNQMEMYQRVAGGDCAAVEVESPYVDAPGLPKESPTDAALITLALPGVPPRSALWRALSVLRLHDAGLVRAQIDLMHGPHAEAEPVTLLRTLVQPTAETDWCTLKRDLTRLKWLDDATMQLALDASGGLSLAEAEAAGTLAAVSLSVLDHPLLTSSTIHARLGANEVVPHAAALAQLFLSRFDPSAPLTNEPFGAKLDATLAAIDTNVHDDESRALLTTMGGALRHTLRTNAHVDTRWGLALRLDPNFFAPALPPSPHLSNMPYGVFFVAGRHFNGYHVRFADIARGGLRVVAPPTMEVHATESRRHFHECFSLAWAQQLKNKDIPEGGSKAVCLVRPITGRQISITREDLMHRCVARMTNSLLDLLVETDDASTSSDSSDPDAASSSSRGKGGAVVTPSAMNEDGEYISPPAKELIYLGPDENITPNDIEWIVARAAKRGYGMANAFMSSKPRAGINHKVYGVTSEGVAVFLAEALRAVGIDPAHDTWSVKLTGGPDGDVAGNMLKILHRDYGTRVRVVGMADGTGCAEDPEGLPMEELLRLFERGDPLGCLNRATLGASAELILADTPAGAARRNTMHNRVVADAFVPAGGRPATMHEGNWQDFLIVDEHGAQTPSAKVIVEGANLFLTAGARAALFDACGLPIVKDSSANKCGVICSSMEIVASMTLSDDEFVHIKEAYVDETIGRLRDLASLEAQLLFAESARNPTEALPSISERISRQILRATSALGGLLDGMEGSRRMRLWPLVREQIAPALYERHAPRLPDRVPWEYQSAMIASGLASRLVYREGLAFVEGLDDGRLPRFALQYLQQEEVVRTLARQVAEHGADWSEQVERLLLRGGVRVAAEQATNSAVPRRG